MANYEGFISCLSGVKDGVARCRNEKGKCSAHKNGETWAKAPRPTTILLKMNLNAKWDKAFEVNGMPIQTRSFERAQQLADQRIQAAAELDRNPYAVRVDSGRAYGLPEDVDTGCPVFGKSGLADTSISLNGLVEELEAEGFSLTGAFILRRMHKPPNRLVMEFSVAGSKPPLKSFPVNLFWELIQTAFQQVDVWANERKSDGKVVHTVNCGKRDDKATPKWTLKFEHGDWNVVSYVPE
jgi:hypothetical protein